MRSVTLGFMLIKKGADEALRIDAAAGNYRIVPNRYDNRGGCFVMFGTNRSQANFEVVPSAVEIENGGSSGPGSVAWTTFDEERRNRRHEKKA